MRAIHLLFVLALLPAALRAQQPAASGPAPIRLSMDEAVRRALASGDEVRLAEAAVRQARGQVRQVWASALPEVRGSLTYQRTFASVFESGGRSSGPPLPAFNPDTTAPLSDRIRYLERDIDSGNVFMRGLGSLFAALPFGRQNTYIYSLTLSQTLFQGGKVGAGIRGAHAFERAAQAQLDDAREDLAFRVKVAYLNALFAERMLEISRATQAQTNEHLRRVEVSHQVGSTADYDLLRAQVESANQEPLVIGARNAFENAQLELRRLVNIPVDQPVELTTAVLTEADSLPEMDTVALRAQLPDRSALAAAEANVDFRRQAIRVFRGDAYPALHFTMNYGGQAFPAGGLPSGSDFRRDWNASVSLSMPLFDGFRNRGIVEQARAELMRAEAQLSQTREGVTIQVAQARSEMARARALVAARRQTVTQAARAHQLASVRYANQIASAIEVSDARLALQQARVNEAQSTRDYLLAIAGLERALGRTVPLARPAQRVAASGVSR
ncbi:MAG: TolC family protein [Gemmatimonadota bacterium]